jgi:hypothetical protein
MHIDDWEILVNTCTRLFTGHKISIPSKNVYLRVSNVRNAKPEATNKHLKYLQLHCVLFMCHYRHDIWRRGIFFLRNAKDLRVIFQTLLCKEKQSKVMRISEIIPYIQRIDIITDKLNFGFSRLCTVSLDVTPYQSTGRHIPRRLQF